MQVNQVYYCFTDFEFGACSLLGLPLRFWVGDPIGEGFGVRGVAVILFRAFCRAMAIRLVLAISRILSIPLLTLSRASILDAFMQVYTPSMDRCIALIVPTGWCQLSVKNMSVPSNTPNDG